MKGIIPVLILSMLLTAFLALSVKPVKADGETVYIMADGSITPSTAPISTLDNVTYRLTDNIADETIVVQKDNILLDGAGYRLHGNASSSVPYFESGTGIDLSERINVTVRNTQITAFNLGIVLNGSSSCIVCGNNITDNGEGIWLNSSSNNIISRNNVVGNYDSGIVLAYSSGSNSVSENDVKANSVHGIVLYFFSDSSISGNNITANSYDGIILYSSLNNNVSGNNLTANRYNGIGLAYSDDNIISGNNITDNNCNGVYLGSSGVNSICGNDVTKNQCGVYLSSSYKYGSGYNSISGNNITDNNVYGIKLDFASNYNGISGNNITDNGCGIELILLSSNNMIYHNNFIDSGQAASVDTSSTNAWDDGYLSGGNYWSDYNGTDLYRAPYQNETGSDGIGDTPCIIDSNNTDNYPLIIPWTPTSYDVALISVVSAKTVIGGGFSCNVAVQVANNGKCPETFNITAYASTIVIGTQQVTNLNATTRMALTFTWNTIGLAPGNYTINAYAMPVPGETDKANNNCTGGWVIVSIIGDITGRSGWPDGKVDILDVAYVAKSYLSQPGNSLWKPNADVNNDGTINIIDISIVAGQFGQHYP
jgi:parallel beta-helix repeat protein